jgi:MFS family permease
MDFKKRLPLVYLSGFLMAAHFALVSYVNSSLLEQFVGDSVLSILYVVGSILGILLLLLVPFLLRRQGSVFTFLLFIILEILAVWGMGGFSSKISVISLFLIQVAVASVLYFCLDVNLEQEIKSESTTGGKRGILLTISNAAWVLSPVALTFLIVQNNFSRVYFLSGIALILLFLLIALFFKNTKRATASEANIFSVLQSLRKSKDVMQIIIVQFLLNFFYAWMVIYLPLLLNKEIGFGWDKIGIIFTIMLLPFLLFELPAGFLADKKFGEREILIAGFLMMSIFTFLIPQFTTPVFWIWASVLFATRIGASFVEIASETYFFKHVKSDNTGLISLFRAVRPLSYIIAPLIVLPIIYFLSYSTSFYFLAVSSSLGLFFIPKKDTK